AVGTSTARPSPGTTGCHGRRRGSPPLERGATEPVRAVAHRVTLVTLAATFVLILFGGLVTNTGAALAVPDWPSTFGYNLLLFPWPQMVGGIFYEHSHRLIGALVGLLTLGLAATLWRAGGRLRWLGLAAVVVVVAQGVLGGLRVVLLADTLAIVHGSLAQAFFGLLSAIAFLTSRAAEHPPYDVDPSLRRLTLTAGVVVYFQIVLGALLTHAGWLALHLAGAVAVFAVVPIVTARFRRSADAVGAPVRAVPAAGRPRGRAPSRALDAMAGDERNRVAPGAGHPRSVAPSRPLDAMAGDERNRVAPGAGHPRSVAPSRPSLQ